MKRNKIILFFVVIFIFGNLFLISQEAKDNKNSEELYYSYEPYKIFNELYNLVSENKQNSKVIYETIEYIKNKIYNKELLLLVDHKNDSTDILSGAFFVTSFYKPQKNKPYILFNKNLIDIFYYQKSIVFSMLVHEIQHAYDYYTNYGLFSVSDNNLLEKYRFQMDALYLEALLIDKYLVPNNFVLTDFEKILLESLQKNNLHEYSLIFETVDMHLIYYLYNMMNSKDSYKKNLNEIIDIGNSLISNFNKLKEDSNEWEKFEVYISLYSYNIYIKQITYGIIYNKLKKMEPDQFEIHDYSPELFKLSKNILELYSPYLDFIYQYRKKYFGKIESIYEKHLEESTRHEFLILDQDLIFLHIIPNDMLKLKENIRPADFLGYSEKEPEAFTKKYEISLKKFYKFYYEKKYEQAAKSLETAIKKDPENPFLLNYYAKALYWFDKDNSFKYYKKLIEVLDKQQIGEKYLEVKNSKNYLSEIKNEKLKKEIEEISTEIAKINKDKIKIDYRFTEAYWKLGTLYLDKSDYLRGIYEITRSMVTTDEYEGIREQAYSFLCESFCFLKKPELANYCAEQVFKINPDNKYVLKFLDMLK